MRRIALLAAFNAVAALRLSRRQALAGVAAAPLVPANAYAAGNLGAALAVFSASNPTVSPFTGFYKDPEHLEGLIVARLMTWRALMEEDARGPPPHRVPGSSVVRLREKELLVFRGVVHRGADVALKLCGDLNALRKAGRGLAVDQV